MAQIEIDGVSTTNIYTYILKGCNTGIELDAFEQEAISRHQNGEIIEEKLNGEWVIDIALDRRSPKFIRYLLEHGHKIRGGKKTLLKSISSGRNGACLLEILRVAEDFRYKVTPEVASLFLIEMSESIFFVDPESLDQVIDYLLGKGADLDFCNRAYDATPLIHAVCCGSLYMVKLLLDAGSDPNGQCPKGSTPIMYAAGKRLPNRGDIFVPDEANLNILELLLVRGANATTLLGKKQDAMYWAKKSGNKLGVKALREHLGMATEQSPKERAREARDSADISALGRLSKDKSKVVRREVASNLCSPQELLKLLMKDSDEEASLRAYENYLERFGKTQPLEQLVEPLKVEIWYRDTEEFFGGEYRAEGRDIMLRKSAIIAKYSSNHSIHSSIVAFRRNKEKMKDIDLEDWIRAQSNIVDNVWLLPDIQRAYVFEFDFGVERVMMNVTDVEIYKEFLDSDQPPGVRNRVVDRLKDLFG